MLIDEFGRVVNFVVDDDVEILSINPKYQLYLIHYEIILSLPPDRSVFQALDLPSSCYGSQRPRTSVPASQTWLLCPRR